MIHRLLIALLILVSCSPSKRLERLERKHPELFDTKIDSTIQIDTVYKIDSILIRDSVFIKAKSDTVKIDTVVFKYRNISFGPIYAHSNDSIAHASATMIKGRFFLDAWATYDTIYHFEKMVDFLRAEINTTKRINIEKNSIIKQKESAIQKLMYLAIGISVLAIALLLLIIYIKRKN